MAKSLSRNTTLDMMKFIASIFVVFIHFSFYGKFGDIVNTLARFAVPLFFMASGFFGYENTDLKVKKKIVKIIKIYIFANLLYFFLLLVIHVHAEGVTAVKSIFSLYLENIKNPKIILLFVFLNRPIATGMLSIDVLWFLLALINVYFIQYIIIKTKMKEKFVFGVAGVLLISSLVLGEGLTIFRGKPLDIILLRNAVFTGFPLFFLGMFIRKHSDKFTKLPDLCLIFLVVLGSAESVASLLCFGRSEMYFGSLLVAASLIIIALKHPELRCSARLENVFSLSLYIYVFHWFVFFVLSFPINRMGIDTESPIYINIIPILVFIATLIFSVLYVKFLSFFKTKIARLKKSNKQTELKP